MQTHELAGDLRTGRQRTRPQRGAAQLLGGDAHRRLAHPRTAVFRRQREAENPQRRHPGYRLVGDQTVLAVPRLGFGRDTIIGETAQLVAHCAQGVVVESGVAERAIGDFRSDGGADGRRVPRRDQTRHRRSAKGLRRRGVEAEVGGTRDLALAHGDAAHDLRQILAERRLQEQGFASSEAAPFLEPLRPRRHLPQRFDTGREPRETVRRELVALESARRRLSLRRDPPRDGGARRREKRVARRERVDAQPAESGKEGGAHSKPIMPRTSAGDFPARRRARNVMARFRFARRTPLASVISA